MKRPTIGITESSLLHHPQTLPDFLFREAYLMAINRAGGFPVNINAKTIQAGVPHLDGILFSGGGDINPHLYGEESDAFVVGVDDLRDRFEMDLLRLAVASDIPFLGICRGLQLINVAQGGALYRDLAIQCPTGMPHDWHPSRKWLAHDMSLISAGMLQEIGFTSEFSVNSLHHQGIREIGSDLSIVACAPDGLIEALQLTGHRFGLAVQWHPEWLIDQQPHRYLFEAFIHACEHTRK